MWPRNFLSGLLTSTPILALFTFNFKLLYYCRHHNNPSAPWPMSTALVSEFPGQKGKAERATRRGKLQSILGELWGRSVGQLGHQQASSDSTKTRGPNSVLAEVQVEEIRNFRDFSVENRQTSHL